MPNLSQLMSPDAISSVCSDGFPEPDPDGGELFPADAPDCPAFPGSDPPSAAGSVSPLSVGDRRSVGSALSTAAGSVSPSPSGSVWMTSEASAFSRIARIARSSAQITTARSTTTATSRIRLRGIRLCDFTDDPPLLSIQDIQASHSAHGINIHSLF